MATLDGYILGIGRQVLVAEGRRAIVRGLTRNTDATVFDLAPLFDALFADAVSRLANALRESLNTRSGVTMRAARFGADAAFSGAQLSARDRLRIDAWLRSAPVRSRLTHLAIAAQQQAGLRDTPIKLYLDARNIIYIGGQT